jgi:hypothetical protein
VTTVDEDPLNAEVYPQPWRTWPTFHRSMYSADHGSMHLGQDPETFRGETLWDVASDAGRRVGLFGPLQSWPPRALAAGGFHVPDTFARSSEAQPPSMRRFQAFNLAMTSENSFSSDHELGLRRLVGAGFDIATKGLRPASAARLGRHLLAERRDRRHKAGRAMMQVLPSFDLYWRLHRRHEPDLSIFFTNHVAAMQHRYWGDGVPGYSPDYTPDPVFATFVLDAMALFDDQLRRIVRGADDDTVVIVASSMGQGPAEYVHSELTYVLAEPQRLIDRLGLHGATPGLAMYPRTSLELADVAQADAALAALTSVQYSGRRLFHDIGVDGRTVSVSITWPKNATALPSDVLFTPVGGDPTPGTIADLGIEVRQRLGGGNTGRHIPEGIFLARGPGITPDPSRRLVSLLDAAPSILDVLGLAPGPSMQGDASVLAATSAPATG